MRSLDVAAVTDLSTVLIFYMSPFSYPAGLTKGIAAGEGPE